MTPQPAAQPVHETISVARDLNLRVDQLYAHWTSPQTRVRWEAGPDTGMAYDGFDTRAGGTEIVRVTHDGREIGHMVQRIVALAPNAVMAVHIEGHFGGQVTMLMQLVLRFLPRDGGGKGSLGASRLEAVTQVTDLTGRDIRAEHEAGWTWLLDRFEADVAAHGPVLA